MAQVFMNLVKQMVIFLVAGQTILHFGMGKPYERYVKLIISLMIIAQFLSAFFGFFSFGKESDFLESGERLVMSFEERFAGNMEEFEKRMKDKQLEFEQEWQKQQAAVTEAPSENETQTDYQQIIVEEIIIQ